MTPVIFYCRIRHGYEIIWDMFKNEQFTSFSVRIEIQKKIDEKIRLSQKN